MPMEQAQILFQSKGRYQYLDIRVKDPDATEDAMQAISDATGYASCCETGKPRTGPISARCAPSGLWCVCL